MFTEHKISIMDTITSNIKKGLCLRGVYNPIEETGTN